MPEQLLDGLDQRNKFGLNVWDAIFHYCPYALSMLTNLFPDYTYKQLKYYLEVNRDSDTYTQLIQKMTIPEVALLLGCFIYKKIKQHDVKKYL